MRKYLFLILFCAPLTVAAQSHDIEQEYSVLAYSWAEAKLEINSNEIVEARAHYFCDGVRKLSYVRKRPYFRYRYTKMRLVDVFESLGTLDKDIWNISFRTYDQGAVKFYIRLKGFYKSNHGGRRSLRRLVYETIYYECVQYSPDSQ